MAPGFDGERDRMSRVRTELRGNAYWVIFDSPENRNALSGQLIAEAREALAGASAEPAARAVVLSHTGNTFCAGVDLAEARRAAPEDQPARLMLPLMRDLITHELPVIAAVDGHVRAGGVGLVGACDLAVATDAASFALTEVRLGLAASVISVVVLPRLRDRDAARLMLGGARHDTAQMVEMGFLNARVDDLGAAVDELLAELVKGSPQGLRETKRTLNAALLADFDARIDGLADHSESLFVSEEAREGMAAFLAKRPPRWAQ